MQRSLSEEMRSKSFWLSVLLHLLLFVIFSTVFVFKPEKKKLPNLYVPSYVYKGAITPSVQSYRATNASPSKAANTSSRQQLTHARRIQQRQESLATSKQGLLPNSLLASTYSMLQNEQRSSLSMKKEEDPIYMIGDENSIADPLVKLVGRALSAHFEYPKMAGEFGIRGRTVLGMTLHPEGYFTDVVMLESSNNEDLDAAALRAVNMAPKVFGADRFISEPKHFVIGFVFR